MLSASGEGCWRRGPALSPTLHAPGSRGKILVMTMRAELGLPLFCPEDNLMRDATSRRDGGDCGLGVDYSPTRRRYRARAKIGGKRVFLGWFLTAELAVRAILEAQDG